MNVFTIPLCSLLLLGACTSTVDPDITPRRATPIDPDASAVRIDEAPVSEAPTAAADVDAMVCSFFWRASVSDGFEPRNQTTVKLAVPGDGRSFELGDARVRVALDDSPDGGARLLLAFDLDKLLIDDVYDFGAASFPANLPGSGHGFTGLHYLAHPESNSELQYTCTAGDAAGPVVTSPSAIQCEWIIAELEASNGVLTLDPGKAHDMRGVGARERVDGFELDAGYMPGGYDSGGVSVDVTAPGGGGVHVLYQLAGSDLPANLFGGAGGFTGTSTMRKRSGGPRFSHHCWTGTK